jgi:hypothetical protein
MKNTHVRKNHCLLMSVLAGFAVTMILGWAVAAEAQAVKGKGTPNFIPVWTSPSTIGDSLMQQAGTNVNVSGGIVATTLSGNGAGVTNVNAATLGALPPGAFAQLGSPNIFTMNQTINGNLTLGGSINNALTLQGNLTDSNLDQSANVIGGFGGNSNFPGNSVATGVVGATIAGGGGGILVGNFAYPNVVTGAWGTIGGGANNQAGGGNSTTVAGGFQNIASSTAATVGGGNQNTASAIDATIGGGGLNTASAIDATIGGGGLNTASGDDATVGGGGNNTASGFSSTVAGGAQNTASFEGATVAGGENNKAAGQFSMVLGGQSTSALGKYSFAAGHIATANYDGSFVWSDTTGIAFDNAPNQFIAQASGGFALYSAPNGTAGVILLAGSGSWSSQSDRSVKSNLSRVDGQALLVRLAALPIATWNYKAQPDSTRHMGPMAQDFHEAFGLGEDDRYISTVDAEGVALAAIQALYHLSQEKDRKIEQLTQEVKELQTKMARLTGEQ